jgi:hypothetical protein
MKHEGGCRVNEVDLRYPIGRFAPPERFDADSRREVFEAIASLPTERPRLSRL